jgi:hypothetical protein
VRPLKEEVVEREEVEEHITVLTLQYSQQVLVELAVLLEELVARVVIALEDLIHHKGVVVVVVGVLLAVLLLQVRLESKRAGAAVMLLV